MTLESSIPEHLRAERRCPRRAGADQFVPPYPSFVARFKPSVKQVVMAYLGVQFRARTPAVDAALRTLDGWLGAAGGPRHHDRARETDAAGFDNVVTIA